MSLIAASSIDGEDQSMTCSDRTSLPPNVFLVTVMSSTSKSAEDRAASSFAWAATELWTLTYGRMNDAPAVGIAFGPRAVTMGRRGLILS